ncbi:MAG: formyl-CoA transferase [Rhodospirillaceae bacterium]|jgi:formyl-CoA transferase|nr:formyl-CoA transferase [Rhodospirillaceae bacterium]MBT6138370.1 formyl-CoA transferase [Rhodospirillaceae bacterium]
MTTTNGVNGALAGVKVLDLTQFEAGPSCTEALGFLGAEVVKVENPKGGDQGRYASADTQGIDSWYFLMFNANKKSITVNLKSPEGLALVKRLAREADVFIENFGPGVIDRLGLSYDVLKEVNPRLIYAQVKGFAEGSPYEDFLSFDMIGQSTGGLMSITGPADGEPCKPGTTLGDTGTGMLMAISILGALYQRQSNGGTGQRLQVAMQDAMLQYSRIAYAVTRTTGKAAPRAGAKVITGGTSPVGIFPCKPGGPNDYVYIYTTRAANHHWERLCKLLGREDMITDERFATPIKRLEHETEIEAILTEWTLQRTKEEAMEVIGKAGVPAGAVFDTMELMNDANLEERGIFPRIEHPDRGEFKVPAWPVKMSGSTVPVRAAPRLGEHTDVVLGDWLSMDAEEVAAVKSSGALSAG